MEWIKINNAIFPYGLPKHCEWTNLEEIITVLQKIGSYPNSNHTFFPRMGGMDLRDARISFEEGCIEFICGNTSILKPKSLTFESFDNPIWNYFRLETENINTALNYDYDIGYSEELTELTPLNYVSRVYWDEGIFDQKPLPATARLVIRRVKAGSYVIFSKSSFYNKYNRTYDARHDNYDSIGFRKYIEKIIQNGWEE